MMYNRTPSLQYIVQFILLLAQSKYRLFFKQMLVQGVLSEHRTARPELAYKRTFSAKFWVKLNL